MTLLLPKVCILFFYCSFFAICFLFKFITTQNENNTSYDQIFLFTFYCTGSFSYTAPDGQLITVSYSADDVGGFQPQVNLEVKEINLSEKLIFLIAKKDHQRNKSNEFCLLTKFYFVFNLVQKNYSRLIHV